MAPEQGGEESRSATTLGTSKRGHRHAEGAVPVPQPRHQTRQEQRRVRRGGGEETQGHPESLGNCPWINAALQTLPTHLSISRFS